MSADRRHLQVVAVACLFAATAVALSLWALGRSPVGETTASPSTDPSAPVTVAPITAEPVEPELEPGTVIATTAVDALQTFDEPGGTAVHEFTKYSYYGQPLTLLAVETKEVDGVMWDRVLLPIQPNQSTGWIREDDVTISSTDVEINIYLDEHELDVVKGDDVTLTAPIAIGTDETPTPVGIYSITDPLDFTPNPTGVYGAYALGLSGFSEVLKTFNDGPPQLAIHGTNQPELIGQSVSNGCIRMHNEDVLVVADAAGLGTPVHVYASRADAEG